MKNTAIPDTKRNDTEMILPIASSKEETMRLNVIFPVVNTKQGT